MENETPTTPEKAPALSLDYKLRLLIAQRNELSAKVVRDSAQRNYQDAAQALNETAMSIGKEMNLDLDKWLINLDVLELVKK